MASIPWAFPLLCRVATRFGRSPAFCTVRVAEVAEAEQVEVQVDTTPEVQGNATTGSGVVGEIWFYPGEPVYKYGVMFPAGYEVWNKPRNFRSYDDAEYYITDVISPAPENSIGEAPEEPNWTFIGKAKDSNGKLWWTYSAGLRRKVVDPAGEMGPYEFDTWMAMNAFLWPPAEETTSSGSSQTPTQIEQEKAASGQIAKIGLRVF